MMQIFNPASSVYGFFTVGASFGTMFALLLGLISIGQSRRQADLISKKNTLDHLLKELDNILDRIIYLKEVHGSTEVHFGRLAIYRARFGQSLILFRNEINLEHIENYIETLNMYSGAIAIVLARIDDKREERIYRKKISSEIQFIEQYLEPLLNDVKESSLSDGLRSKSLSILESVEALKEDVVGLKII